MNEETQMIRLRLITSSGSELETIVQANADEDVEDIAASFVDELGQRPRWMAIGNLTVFSGAISAIEVETYP